MKSSTDYSQRIHSEGFDTENPDASSRLTVADAYGETPVDGWWLWVLFLLVLIGGLSIAMLLGF